MKCARFVNGRCEQCGMLRAFYGECAVPQPADLQSPAQMTRDELRVFVDARVEQYLVEVPSWQNRIDEVQSKISLVASERDHARAEVERLNGVLKTIYEQRKAAEEKLQLHDYALACQQRENETLRSTLQAKRHESEMWRKSFQAYVAATGKAESIAAAYESARDMATAIGATEAAKQAEAFRFLMEANVRSQHA